MISTELFSLEGKNVVLTGAAGFFGQYFAEALLAHGASHVDLLDRQEESLRTLHERLVVTHGSDRVSMTVIDQYDRNQAERIFQQIVRTRPIHVLVNNAFDFSLRTGFNDPSGRAECATFDQLQRSFESGVYWGFQATQIIANDLIKRKLHGSIINIGSMYALISPSSYLYEGTEKFNPPGYGMMKSAVLASTKYTASFFGPNIRANILCPGAIPNQESQSYNAVTPEEAEFMQRLVDRTLLRRVGHPTDLIGPIVFLASDASSYMTGQTLVVDGGWTVI